MEDVRRSLLLLEPSSFCGDARKVLAQSFKVEDFDGRTNRSAEVVIGGLARRMDGDLLQRFPRMKTLVSLTTGLNHVDTEYLAKRGVRLVSLRDIQDSIRSVTSTSELTIGLILSLARRIFQASYHVAKEGSWDRMEYFGPQLKGRKLGIIGYGRIGSSVANSALSLGLEVEAYDIKATVPERLFSPGLEPLLRSSDVVSLHANYSGYEILTTSRVAMLRAGALVVNTARGELVDETAIARAVDTGKLGGYAVDVLRNEYQLGWNPAEEELVKLAREGRNVIVTPHLGGCTVEAFRATQLAIAHHLRNLETIPDV